MFPFPPYTKLLGGKCPSFIGTEGNIENLSTGSGEYEVVKEGIHFDLEHRNRIEWYDESDEALEDFKNRLTNRIKAIIV